MKFQQICLTALLAVLCSSCAFLPKATLQTNIPFFYGGVIKVYNSAGDNIILIPQSQGDGFIAEYKYGDRKWYKLGMREKTPVRLVTLQNGESFTLPIYRNTSRNTVHIPVAVKVLEVKRKKVKTVEVVGFYNRCFAVSPLQDSNFDFNFSKRELNQLKNGYTGQGCNSYGSWWW